MRKLLWLACVAVGARGANSLVEAASGGGGTRLLLEKVSPRNQDEVSKHKTESANVELAELADARKGGKFAALGQGAARRQYFDATLI